MINIPKPFSDEIVQCWASQDYRQAEYLHQQEIETDPSNLSNYWYLGLALLLQEREEEAQMTWTLPFLEADEGQVERWTRELIELLDIEASNSASQKPEAAWLIRQHIREISPNQINNNLLLILLSIQLDRLQSDWFQDWGIIEQLHSSSNLVNAEILSVVLRTILRQFDIDQPAVELLQVGMPLILDRGDDFCQTLIQTANRIAFALKKPDLAVQLGELCLPLISQSDEDNRHNILIQLSTLYQENRQYSEAVSLAKKSYELSKTIPQKIVALHRCLSGQMLTGGDWHTGHSYFLQEQELLRQFIGQLPDELDASIILRLMTSTFFQPYFRDEPQENRSVQNQVMAFCQDQLRHIHSERIARYSKRSHPLVKEPQALLKVGYLSHCLKRHSVGWITRWLFEHHDHEQVQVYLYLVGSDAEGIDPMQDWFVNHADIAHRLPANPGAIADKIYDDDIDILVELDSLTLDTTCAVLALKPAPVQVSWLGWDAPGLPSVDYYIVDPHVVPDNADEYYSEKLWRLPQTYVAVDGFEIGIPTLRRDHLDIPTDAIVYLSTQRGHKLHPESVQQQLQIIRAVEHSYLLVKVFGQENLQQKFWHDMAEQAGVSSHRIRFMPEVPSELTHRANMQIADVALDTYPYNGATTTLETLWMGIPLVTRVGQQFSSRNSYTMMKNAGVTEGIAWSNGEYVEWGIRLGRDESLRQHVEWKLRQSRHTSPLWNAKKLTKEMENAYQQIWSTYCGQPMSIYTVRA